MAAELPAAAGTGRVHQVLAIAGSLRQGSFNRRLLEAAVSICPRSLRIQVHDGLGAIPLFDEDLEQSTNGGPPAVKELRELVRRSDALLLATPEYNQSMSGVLKNVIDWLSRPDPDEVLIAKPVGIVGASGGRWGTRLAQANLRQVLTATEALVMPQPSIFVAEAARGFDAAGLLTDDLLRKQLEKYLSAFAHWVALVSAPGLSSVQ